MHTTLVAGRYALGEHLGSGGMAEVYRATDQVLDRQVAVKVFGRTLDPQGPGRARSEMRTLAGLCHPGLVALFDAGTDTLATGEQRAFLVMQLVDGPTLAERFRSGPLTHDEIRRLALDTAGALAYVHARGVVHRDVKPANILLDADGRARIADFGIAQTLGQESMTATGLLLGTVPYLSPEQVRGQSATSASDVYALGLVLLEAHTGQREYPGMTAEGALARLTRPPLVTSELPQPWARLLTAMTAMEPTARPSAQEVIEALLAGAYEETEPTRSVAAFPQWPAARGLQVRGRGPRAAAMGAAAAALVAAAAAVSVLPGAAGPSPARPAAVSSPSPLLAPVSALVTGRPAVVRSNQTARAGADASTLPGSTRAAATDPVRRRPTVSAEPTARATKPAKGRGKAKASGRDH